MRALHPIIHGLFSVEHSFRAPPPRVYAAFADVEQKARWFTGPPDRWKPVRRELVLAVGGSEVLHGKLGAVSTIFTARYHALVPNQQLVFTHDVHVGDRHASTSLTTVELFESPEHDNGTRLVHTEQIAIFDDEPGAPPGQHDTIARRKAETHAQLERLALVVEG